MLDRDSHAPGEEQGTSLRSDRAGGLGNDVGSFLGGGGLYGTLGVTWEVGRGVDRDGRNS